MVSINLPKNLTFGMKLLYALLGVAIIIVIVCVIIFNRSNYLAKTMKLVRAEGTVRVEKEGGKLKPISKNSRFESGEALFTGLDGLATVSLDDKKFVTLQPDSRVEFSKVNKQLGLKLTKGGMFFEVTEKLKDGEIFEIKTSTMTAGIKGTSGYFCLDVDGNETLTVTDGKLIISAVNPETGERKYAEVSGGQRITVYLYSETTKEHDTIELDVVDIGEEDLEDFTLKMLGNDERLLTKVCEYTGWNRDKLKELINAILVKQVTPVPTESSESSEPEDTSESSETDESKENTPTPTSAPTNTDKPDPTATPKPNAKATATPKPKNNNNNNKPSGGGNSSGGTTKPTNGSENPSGGGNDDPTGGGNDNPSGGGNDNPSGGGNDNPSGGGNDNPSGGGNDNPSGGGNDNPSGGGNDNPSGGGNDNPSGGGSSSGGGSGETQPPKPENGEGD
jgi:hypothetical protein